MNKPKRNVIGPHIAAGAQRANVFPMLSRCGLLTMLIIAALAAPVSAQPVPQPRPEEQAPDRMEKQTLPETMAAPEERPDEPAKPSQQPHADEKPDSGVKAEVRPRIVPPDEMACRAELTRLGVVFTTRAAISEPQGCKVDFPLEVTRLGKDMALTPAAIMNCALARAAAQFLQGEASRIAEARLGARIGGVSHASTYVCRPRNGSSKLSEHAFANALDIAAFELADGRSVTVRAYGPVDRDSRDFLREVRGAACGPFKTVLGPGSDADHADHLHLDLAQRRNGGTYCQ